MFQEYPSYSEIILNYVMRLRKYISSLLYADYHHFMLLFVVKSSIFSVDILQIEIGSGNILDTNHFNKSDYVLFFAQNAINGMKNFLKF
ncbi:hypothetical protein X798_03875 [Onchocerca flexuosa]|uniref:Uncharacterized protein n=1 Tax=Onchocerca flexuosa TaxID=387005 RepID=A0A238BWZ6_9BILA|nr:hypothetical protein X798_03875 [Onchocerca flexuosa]